MKHIIISLISAALLSISWPTYGIPFFIFVALVPLMMAEHDIAKFSKIKRKGWRIFILAYLTFFIWNLVTTGWLYGSRNPDGSHSIPAVALPVLLNSLFYALVFLCYHWYKKTQGTYWGLAFLVAIWMAFEKLHLSWELTWPWLNLGNVFSEYPKFIQWYDTVGATGGSFWILLVNVWVFYTLRIWQAGRKRKALIKNLSILALGILLPTIVSIYKYNNFNEKPIGEVSVLMLQPELDPYEEKYQKDSLQILHELLDLAKVDGNVKVDYFLAPETAVPGRGSISETGFSQSLLLQEIQKFLENNPNSVFASGMSTHRFFKAGEALPSQAYELDSGDFVVSYNSAVQLTNGESPVVYHKAKLVPGVEIFPYMNFLKPVIGNAMLDFGGTVASLGIDEERAVFANPYNQGKMAPVICYESIYGEFVTEYIRKGANFIGIMTNDSWWGVSEGHRQLLSYARLRAIETRREIARSANSGISAHINALGEIEADTLYGDRTALFAKVKLYGGTTPYTRGGDLISRICIFALGFLIFYTLIKKWQAKRQRKI